MALALATPPTTIFMLVDQVVVQGAQEDILIMSKPSAFIPQQQTALLLTYTEAQLVIVLKHVHQLIMLLIYGKYV
jgi:hypothetical protein